MLLLNLNSYNSVVVHIIWILIYYVLKRFHLFHFYKIKNFMLITANVFCHCAILDVRILNNFNVMTEILYILCVDVFTYYLLGHKCKVMNWVQQQQVQMVLKILIHILVQPGGKSYYVKNVNYHLLHKTFFWRKINRNFFAT